MMTFVCPASRGPAISTFILAVTLAGMGLGFGQTSWGQSAATAPQDAAAARAVEAPVVAAKPEPLNYQPLTIEVASSQDQTPQPCRLDVPLDYDPNTPAVPLVVLLHSWSGDYRQGNKELEQLVAARGWLCVMPNFRGPNQQPEACASSLAQADILDAVDWVKSRYRIDPRRIYLCGASGGGHMTMMMAAQYPDRWRAASAWVGISDLVAWHARHAGDNYGKMLRLSCGGAPGDSQQVDAQYQARSPIHFLAGVGDLPLDLAAGVHDGHRGSVPIAHTLNAFNVIATAHQATPVSAAEMEEIGRGDGRLKSPQAGDELHDKAWGRDVYLRRQAGKSRVTIFEGGHEGIPAAMLDWFLQHGGQGIPKR